MSDIESETLYNTMKNSERRLIHKYKIIKNKNKKNNINKNNINKNNINIDDYNETNLCCCINEVWCFNHTGISALRGYDTNINNYCTCLDCCSWCLVFNCRKTSICEKETNCYICCCTIYFYR